jgi:hypothetical protein
LWGRVEAPGSRWGTTVRLGDAVRFVAALLDAKRSTCRVEIDMVIRDMGFGGRCRRTRGGVIVAIVLGCLTAAGGTMPGCSEKKPTKTATPAPALERYTVRGIVTALADPARKGSPYMMIHHVEIPNFKDKTGAVVGMKEMIMPFPLGPGVSVSADALAVGDKVEVVFEVDWTKAPAHYALSFVKLPAETELGLKSKGGDAR